jgi:hypothetical protein
MQFLSDGGEFNYRLAILWRIHCFFLQDERIQIQHPDRDFSQINLMM